MAPFSFRSGNAAKLLRTPLYALGRIGTLLIPRGRRWVFGCGIGIGDGALALWHEAVAAGADAVWLVSSDRDAEDAAARGIRTLRKSGIRGWWATARAGVIVVTHGLGDVHPQGLGGGLVVQLWHGIPLKRIGLDSPATVQVPSVPGASILRRLIGLAYRSAQRHIDILPAASDRARGRLESAFGLGSDRVLVTGEPRVDVLSAGEPEQRRARAAELLQAAVGPIPEQTRTVLYAPTWRDGDPDPAVPDAAEWTRIIALLERHDAVLLVRPHPLGEGAYAPVLPTRRVRMLRAATMRDVTPALARIDVLITDYSSLAYDVGLLGTPVLFLAPDAAQYGRTRGFYDEYAQVAPDAVSDWLSLRGQLDALLGDPAEFAVRSERSRTLSRTMHAFRDGRNTHRVHRAILARIAAGKDPG